MRLQGGEMVRAYVRQRTEPGRAAWYIEGRRDPRFLRKIYSSSDGRAFETRGAAEAELARLAGDVRAKDGADISLTAMAASEMGRRRWAGVSPEERSATLRRAAEARWSRDQRTPKPRKRRRRVAPEAPTSPTSTRPTPSEPPLWVRVLLLELKDASVNRYAETLVELEKARAYVARRYADQVGLGQREAYPR